MYGRTINTVRVHVHVVIHVAEHRAKYNYVHVHTTRKIQNIDEHKG